MLMVTVDQVRSVWEKGRVDLGIPKTLPAKLTEEGVWGVGSNTPD